MPDTQSLVECRNCTHTWLYRGIDEYAKCPNCGVNNTLSDDDVTAKTV